MLKSPFGVIILTKSKSFIFIDKSTYHLIQFAKQTINKCACLSKDVNAFLLSHVHASISILIDDFVAAKIIVDMEQNITMYPTELTNDGNVSQTTEDIRTLAISYTMYKIGKLHNF